MSMMKVLDQRLIHFAFAEIVFPPLVWLLVTTRDVPELGINTARSLANASDWVRYSRDRARVDLRSIVRNLPFFAHPMFGKDRTSWLEMHGEQGTDSEAVIIHGKIP
ncbi:hypothetical protein [Actinokineospora globicatena]|uniref:hypothetical protein n=1 Tax=Actinokineospora globicatena TaxID=103729 RepID=UPI002554020B|nr:hypothetical protein [Actinokineospora globicatena]